MKGALSRPRGQKAAEPGPLQERVAPKVEASRSEGGFCPTVPLPRPAPSPPLRASSFYCVCVCGGGFLLSCLLEKARSVTPRETRQNLYRTDSFGVDAMLGAPPKLSEAWFLTTQPPAPHLNASPTPATFPSLPSLAP